MCMYNVCMYTCIHTYIRTQVCTGVCIGSVCANGVLLIQFEENNALVIALVV